jgi:PAS domain S-box-containing protein
MANEPHREDYDTSRPVRLFETSSVNIMPKKPTYQELEEKIRALEKHEAETLRKSEWRYRDLVEGSIQGILIHRDHKPLFVNREWAAIHGYAPEEVLRMKSVIPLISSNDRTRMIEYKDARLQGESAPITYEYEGVRKDGSLIWLENRVMIVQWEGKEAIQTIIVDISERKRAEGALQQSEQRYRAVVEDMPVLICSFLPGGRITFVNQTYCQYFNKSSEELIGSNFLDLIPEPEKELVLDNVRSLTSESPIQSHEHRVLAPNGVIRWQKWTNRAFFDNRGNPIEYHSIGEDVTERRQAADALKASEEKFRRMFQDIILGIFQSTPDGRIVHVNRAFAKMFGYASPQALVDTVGDSAEHLYAHPRDRLKLIRLILASDIPIVAEVNFCRKDGSHFVGNFHGWKVFDATPGNYYLEGFIEDITERKVAENSLQESHKRLQFLSARLLSAQENEQRRIALEIHDVMGQDLALLKMQLIAFAKKLRKDQQKLRDDINQALIVIDGIIEKARNMSRDLNPAIIEDLKLSGAMSWLIHDIEKHVAVRILLDMEPVDHLFSTEHQIIIYRIVQEALKNIVKHANADTAVVTIRNMGNHAQLIIKDDGKGFDITEVWKQHVADRGLGLAALDERGRMLGGTLEIQSEPGKGTSLSLRIPI